MPELEIDAVKLHYEVDGPEDTIRPPIVLLHGFARNGRFWKEWIPYLTARFRVVRPDIRGCGRSGDPGIGFHLEKVVADLLEMIDLLQMDTVHLAGESTGGIAGAIAAARAPERFASLALISTPISPARGNDRVMSPGAASPVESMTKLGLRRWWMESRALTGDLFGDERDEELASEFALTPLGYAISMWEAMHDPGLSLGPYLKDLQIPVLVISPSSSLTVSVADQAELTGGISSARQVLYPGASHFVMYLQAEMVANDYF